MRHLAKAAAIALMAATLTTSCGPSEQDQAKGLAAQACGGYADGTVEPVVGEPTVTQEVRDSVVERARLHAEAADLDPRWRDLLINWQRLSRMIDIIDQFQQGSRGPLADEERTTFRAALDEYTADCLIAGSG